MNGKHLLMLLIAISLTSCFERSSQPVLHAMQHWDEIKQSGLLKEYAEWSVVPNYYDRTRRLRSGISITAPTGNRYYFTGLSCGRNPSLELLWTRGIDTREDSLELSRIGELSTNFLCRMELIGLQSIIWHREGFWEVFSNRGDSTYNELWASNPKYHDRRMEYPEIHEEYGDENYPFVFVYMENTEAAAESIERIAEATTLNYLEQGVYYYRHFQYSRSSSLELYR